MTTPAEFRPYIPGPYPSLPGGEGIYLVEELEKIAHAFTQTGEIDRTLEDDIGTVSEDLSDEIAAVSAAVTTEITTRETADEAFAQQIITVAADFNTAISTVSASVTDEATARATADEALATSIETAEASIADVAASVTDEATARANADEALATSIETAEASIADVSASVTDEATARANADEALATSIETAEASIADVSASVTDEATARANADSALADDITTLTTVVDGNTATLTTHGSSIDGIAVKYALTGTINGITGGFTFSGLQQIGGGTVYNLEIDANVTINGNLLVNGTVLTEGIETGGVTETSVFVGATDVDVADAGDVLATGTKTLLGNEGGEATVLVQMFGNFAADRDPYDNKDLWGLGLFVGETMVRAFHLYPVDIGSDSVIRQDASFTALVEGLAPGPTDFSLRTIETILGSGPTYSARYGSHNSATTLPTIVVTELKR